MIHYDIADSPNRITALCEAKPQPGDSFIFLDTGAPTFRTAVDCSECKRRFDRLHRDTAFIAPKPAVTMDDEGMVWA